MRSQQGVVRLHNGSGQIRRRVNLKTQFGFLSVINAPKPEPVPPPTEWLIIKPIPVILSYRFNIFNIIIFRYWLIEHKEILDLSRLIDVCGGNGLLSVELCKDTNIVIRRRYSKETYYDSNRFINYDWCFQGS